jgi:NAD(P)-dependent dehydrogenase (short-subunit alcohol dehydrogenase family)
MSRVLITGSTEGLGLMAARLLADGGHAVTLHARSNMHLGGSPDLTDPQWEHRRWNGSRAYSDSKLFDVVLAFAVARLRTGVLSNALNPGWAPTKMAGPGAPDDITLAATTQAWLAVSADPQATVTGEFFYHQKPHAAHPAAQDPAVQDQLLSYCAALTGVTL